MPHDREIVCDEDVGKPELLLDVFEQVHDLCLDRDIERRHRLVEDHHLWVQRQSSRHADPLSLTSRELMGETVAVLGVQTDRLE